MSQPDPREALAQLVGSLLFGARSCCVRCRSPVLHAVGATQWEHECSDPTLGALLREARRETSGDLSLIAPRPGAPQNGTASAGIS